MVTIEGKAIKNIIFEYEDTDRDNRDTLPINTKPIIISGEGNTEIIIQDDDVLIDIKLKHKSHPLVKQDMCIRDLHSNEQQLTLIDTSSDAKMETIQSNLNELYQSVGINTTS